jgi:hypothetical protein
VEARVAPHPAPPQQPWRQQQQQPAKRAKPVTKPAIVVSVLIVYTRVHIAFIEFTDLRAFRAALAMGDSLTLDGQRATVAPANRNPTRGQQQPAE